jgi:hypothetical protein
MLTIDIALNAYAKMMNNFSIVHLEPLLADDLHYASQWVFEEITSKQTYLDYIAPKLLAIKNTDNKVFAEMGLLEVDFPGPCVVIAQGDKNNLVATVLIKVEDNKIKRIDMCAAPSPHSAKRTGIYPS